MADKSKMTVAEMLAAARKADAKGGGDSAAAPTESTPADVAPPGTAAAPPAPPAKNPAAAGGALPSVAEMLAMARAGKSESAEAAPAAAAKPAPPAAKPAAAKAAPPKKEAPPVKSGPVDTQSILAAARTGAKPGPMTKAEAAARGAAPPPDAKKAKAKEAIVVPPMPVRPDYAKPAAKRGKDEKQSERRAFLFGISAQAVGYTALGATLTAWTLATVEFMFPNILREPASRFTVGKPSDFAPGHVEEKYKAERGVWIVNAEYNGEQQIVAIKSVCTHLGCTPNWLEAEQKFKCPCHGSGFYKDGINFEGPAPRPLERYAISIAASGELEIDKSRTFQEEMGEWSDPNSFVPV